MKPFVFFFAACSLLTFGGCDMRTEYEDVSSDPSLASFLGARYEFRVPMHISGVNLPPGYGKTVDIYTLNPASPSWTGPELITRETLPVGSVVQVESIHRATNIPFHKKAYVAHVRILGYSPPFDLPIQLSFDSLNSDALQKVEEPNQPVETTAAGARPPRLSCETLDNK